MVISESEMDTRRNSPEKDSDSIKIEQILSFSEKGINFNKSCVLLKVLQRDGEQVEV